MRVLQLCHKPPLPLIDGGCIAIHHFSRGILECGYELKVLTLCTDKHPFLPDAMTDGYRNATQIEAIYVDTRVNMVEAFASLITQDNYNISRFFSVDMDILLKQTLRKNRYDLVQLESLFMTPYIATIRRYSKAKIVLRSHNLEHNIWDRLASQEKNGIKKIYLNYLAKQLKTYEIKSMADVDGIISISEKDREQYLSLGCIKPVQAIPTAIDMTEYEAKVGHTTGSIFHLGAMDWAPNIEGIHWFLDLVWPLVLDVKPGAKLHLAGKNLDFSSAQYKKWGNSVILDGEVPDAIQYMNSKDIMVIPLLSGGGIRIKMLEGMALSKCIVTTRVGAEGIGGKSGVEYFVADGPEEFAKALLLCLEEPELTRSVGENARRFIAKNFSYPSVNAKIAHFYNRLLS